MSNRTTKALLFSVVFSVPGAYLALFIGGKLSPEILNQTLEGSFAGILLSKGFGLFVATALLMAIVSILVAKAASSAEGSAETTAGAADDENDGRESGIVKWFNVSKGFGFITRDQGDDIFVHFRSIRGRGHRSLRQGQRVRFSVSEGDKGLQADDVSPIDA